MIKVSGAHLVVDEPVTELSAELPEGIDELELLIMRASAPGRETEELGRWVFRRPPAGRVAFKVNWLAHDETVTMTSPADPGRILGPSEAYRRPEAPLWPEMTIHLGAGPDTAEVRVKVTDVELLRRYYQSETHQEEYVSEHPFFLSFHKARLRTLERTFQRYIEPGSRVLDVGSGYSIFFLITTEWDFDITCCDLDSAAMDKMKGLVPQWEWVVADAADLPWEDGSFDAVYAGEIIEHVPRPEEALAEWKRALMPEGLLILSTPNRDRLLSRANRTAMPVHHEHLREMNLPELKQALIKAGFEVLKVTGIYMELLLNWYRPPGKRVDMLVNRFNQPRYRFLYRLMMSAGRLSPSRAYDLVVVCRRR